MANADGLVTEPDVRAAQALLDELVATLQATWPTATRLELRGRLASWSAAVRTAGYLEGVQRGRQEAAHVVLDALQGEGLAP